jgi:hypothetical protein
MMLTIRPPHQAKHQNSVWDPLIFQLLIGNEDSNHLLLSMNAYLLSSLFKENNVTWNNSLLILRGDGS